MARTKKDDIQNVVVEDDKGNLTTPVDSGGTKPKAPAKPKAPKTTETKQLVIPPIDIRFVDLYIIGDSPLIMHAWSEKAKRMILEKQMKIAKAKGHDVRNPVEDFIDSMYWGLGKPETPTEEAFNEAIANGATFKFPTVAFKESAVAAGFRSDILKNKVTGYAAFHILGEYTQIFGSTPVMREDMVRIGMGTADLRYRGQFDEWYTKLQIRYNAGVITVEQIANLLNFGGFACGLGEWRAEKGGSFGFYHVASEEEIQVLGVTA